MPSLDAVTSWLEVLAVLLLVAAAGVFGWEAWSPAAGLAVAGVSAGAGSVVLQLLGRRGRS